MTLQRIEKLRRNNNDFTPVCVGPVRLTFEQRFAFIEEVSTIADKLSDNSVGRNFKGTLRIQEWVLSTAVEERELYNEEGENSNAAKDSILGVIQNGIQFGRHDSNC